MFFRYYILLFCLSFNAFAFESYEHRWLGDSIDIPFPDGMDRRWIENPYSNLENQIVSVKEFSLTKPKPFYLILGEGEDAYKISFGEIVAMAGDYFSILTGSISSVYPATSQEDPKDKFMRAFHTMIPSHQNTFQPQNTVKQIRKIIQEELQGILGHVAQYNYDLSSPNTSINSTSKRVLGSFVQDQYGIWRYRDDLHTMLIKATTLGSEIYDSFVTKKGTYYIPLAELNFDHFGKHAQEAYLTGHGLALEVALKAHEAKDKATKYHLLNKAYAMDAFACHFLSDLFSAGHLRTPRAELYNGSYVLQEAGLLAKAMHDEDSYYGLKVKNSMMEWEAYGDNSYFSSRSFDNRREVRNAIEASVKEVFAVYTEGRIKKVSDVLSYFPVVIEKSQTEQCVLGDMHPFDDVTIAHTDFSFEEKCHRTHPALFRANSTNKVVESRDSYENIFSENYAPLTAMTWVSSYLVRQDMKKSRIDFRSLANVLGEDDIVSVHFNCFLDFQKGSVERRGFYLNLKDYNFQPDFGGRKTLVLAQGDLRSALRECKVMQIKSHAQVDLKNIKVSVTKLQDIHEDHVAPVLQNQGAKGTNVDILAFFDSDGVVSRWKFE